MVVELDEIIYAALTANPELSSLAGGIHSTCIEVPPTDADNTSLPYIIITDDPFQNNTGTKDNVWEGDVDSVQTGVEIAADSPKEVKRLRRLVRKAVADYIETADLDNLPYLQNLTNEGIAWDWTKPCYYDTLHYQADMDVNLNDE
jgi:hypothetical protein